MSQKNILFDCSTLTKQVDGLSVYIINLLDSMLAVNDNKFKFTVLVNPGLERPEFFSIVERYKLAIITHRIAPIGPKRDWHMFRFLKEYRGRFDLVHIPNNWSPIMMKGGIVTIHDLTFKRFFDSPKLTYHLAVNYMGFVVKRLLNNADGIIAVSESTKNDLIRYYKLSDKQAKKIKVIYEGWQHFETNNSSQAVCKEPVETQPYLFYVGTNRKHKNIERLIIAFEEALKQIDQPVKLIITGSNKYMSESLNERVARLNQGREKVKFTGYLPDECVKQYFKHASAFIFPSLSEGFGLPVLEAFYYGVPVLCSNTTSLPELGGDAVMYFDPSSEAAIARTIVSFFKNPAVAEELKAKGKERLSLFSWKKAAAETMHLYEQTLEASRSNNRV